MDRTEELALIQRCIDLDAAGSTTLGAHTGSSAAERYTDGERFELEMRAIHRTMPVPWLHAGELPAPGTFKTLATPLGSVLANRDAQGQAHAFHNVCRHRGAQLVAEAGGESSRFTCPYHAWSYGLDGALLAVPGRDECFPGLEAAERGLAAIPVVEAFGLLWLCPGAPGPGDARAHLDEHLGEMAHNLAWLDMASLHVFKRHTRVWRANWKLLSEGGLESYHFRTAHRNTIGPYFLHNCSVQDRLGLHSRMVLPTKKIERQRELPEGERRLRDFSHILFGVAPQSSFLTQEGHVDWIRMTPLTVDSTEVEIVSLVPDAPAAMSDKSRKHWDTNFDITLATLDEDFVIGEGIQHGLASGANAELLFGRNEGLLGALNDWVEAQLAD